MTWTETLEKYFASAGEKAHCLSYLHKRSEAMFSYRRAFIDLPIIVGSGLIAFLNAGSSSLFEDPKVASVSLGIGSLFMGVLNSIGTYYNWAKRAEGHRVASIHYARMHRFLTIEMALPREERMSPADLLKYTKEQYDRLTEIAPMLPAEAVAEFKQKFKDYDISRPSECNGLERIVVFNEPVTASGGPPSFELSPPTNMPIPQRLRTSTAYRIPDTSRTSSSVRPPSASEADNNRTSSSSCNQSTT